MTPPDRLRSGLAEALAAVPPEGLEVPPDGRVAAVLVLLVDDPDHGPSLLLTRRRHDLRSHPGQLSFPGGRVEDGETVEQAALREAQEEVALRADTVTLLGRGRTFYLPPSRFWVAPVVAWWDEPHDTVPSPTEVDAVLRVPLATLRDPDTFRAVPLSAGGATWAWQLDDDLLWGMTAIVTALLLSEVEPDWHGGIDPSELPADRQRRPWEDAPSWTPRTRLPDLPGRDVHEVPSVGRAGVRNLLAGLGRDGVRAVVDRAAEAVVAVVDRLLDGVEGREVTVLVGPAGTGRIGLAAARLLHDQGCGVTVRLADARDDVDLPDHEVVAPPETGRGVELDRGLGPALDVPELDRPPGDLVVDALLGPGADPPLRDGPALLALWAARTDVKVVAVALPSGVAADHGLTGPSLHADVTVALGLPTTGLLAPIVAPYAGEIVVADVGIPTEAWADVGHRPPDDLFADGPLVRLDRGPVNSDAGTPDQGVTG